MRWRALRGSLFLKIYLTLLASLAAVALVSAAFVKLGQDEEATGWRARRDAVVAAMLPQGEEPDALARTLERLSAALDGDIAVFDPSGRLVAGVGRPFPPDTAQRRRRLADDRRAMVMHLPDGRTVAFRTEHPFGPEGGNPLAYLAAIAGAIGLAAYPVVRHLTRRLERLRRGVDAWGEGALVTRVPEQGSDEVAAVARSFNRAAAQLERMVASHRALLANASHELRSPLARLRMAIDLREHSAAGGHEEEIVRNLAELDSLVDEILLASRLDHVEALDHAEPVDLLALASEEGARCGVEVTGDAAIVAGDPRLLGRLVRNLMQNALRHGAPPVTAEIGRVPGVVRLRVRDHGPGVPEGEVERVFEAFYRPSGRSETSGGWGLGLSLVRQIARHHAATVRYEQPPDGGARFVVEFPDAEAPARANA